MKQKKWLGGYVLERPDGRQLFIIAKMVRGKRYHLSTRCHGERQALKQLAYFEANPDAYSPTGNSDQAVEPVTFSAELLQEFTAWQEKDKGVTSRHAYYTAKYLADWIEDLKGEDLRSVTLREHVDPAIAKRKGATAHRIAALKVFYKWLRTKKRLLVSADDCTLDLLVPQARPEKRRRKKAVDHEIVEKVISALRQHYRDVLLFMACTGWHLEETKRFVRDAKSELVELTPEQVLRDGCLAVAKTWHKGKLWTVTPIKTQQHLEAARRMRGRGVFPRKFNEELKTVAIALGGDKKTGAPYYFTLGKLRHSFSSWQVKAGADIKRVSVALDHKDERTTRDFYVDMDVPRSDLPAIEFDVQVSSALH